MATAHLISGLPASGKSTYAKLLKMQTGAVLFRLDKWLKTLFGDYSLEDVENDEHVRRVLATREMIWFSAAEFLIRGIDIILDDGFFFEKHRLQHINLAKEIGAEACVHFLNTPIEVIGERLNIRNSDLPKNTFFISTDKLKFFQSIYETPNPNKEGKVQIVLPEAIDISSLVSI